MVPRGHKWKLCKWGAEHKIGCQPVSREVYRENKFGREPKVRKRLRNTDLD